MTAAKKKSGLLRRIPLCAIPFSHGFAFQFGNCSSLTSRMPRNLDIYGLFTWGDNPMFIKMAPTAKDLKIIPRIIRIVMVFVVNFCNSLSSALSTPVFQSINIVSENSCNYTRRASRSHKSYHNNNVKNKTRKTLSIVSHFDRQKLEIL